jgi:putative transposase
MNVFEDLKDSEWALVKDLFDRGLSPNSRRGRPPADARAVVNAVLWVLASGGSWVKLPGRYPSTPTCRRRFENWQDDGTFAEIVRRLKTSGREISLPGKLRNASSKSMAQPFSNRLRGTDPAFWRPSLTVAISPV